MSKHLISNIEAEALRRLVARNPFSDALQTDKKNVRPSHFPFRFKLKETIGATTPYKANAAIYYLGGTTDVLHETTFVTDDSSEFAGSTSGTKGLCLASSEYFIVFMNRQVATAAKNYIGQSTTDYATTDATVVIDNLEPMDGVGTTAATLSCNNRFQWAILENKYVKAEWNDHTSVWDLTQAMCT